MDLIIRDQTVEQMRTYIESSFVERLKAAGVRFAPQLTLKLGAVAIGKLTNATSSKSFEGGVIFNESDKAVVQLHTLVRRGLASILWGPREYRITRSLTVSGEPGAVRLSIGGPTRLIARRRAVWALLGLTAVILLLALSVVGWVFIPFLILAAPFAFAGWLLRRSREKRHAAHLQEAVVTALKQDLHVEIAT